MLFFHHLYKKIVFFCSHLNMFLKEKNCNLQLLTRRAFDVNHIFFNLWWRNSKITCSVPPEDPSFWRGSWRSPWFCCAWELPLRPCRWPWCSSHEHHDVKGNVGYTKIFVDWYTHIYIYIYTLIYTYIYIYTTHDFIYTFFFVYVYTLHAYIPSQNECCIMPTNLHSMDVLDCFGVNVHIYIYIYTQSMV